HERGRAGGPAAAAPRGGTVRAAGPDGIIPAPAPARIEQGFAYWGDGPETAVGAAAGGAAGRRGRALAGVGEGRSRRRLVGVGVVGAGVRRPARAQGGPGARERAAPAGSTRGLPAGAAASARPGRAEPGH